MTCLALQLARDGLCAREIVAQLEAEKANVRVIAMVDTLEYLHKGGRLSKSAAIAGSLLNIKPILTIRDGEIAVLGKARGLKQGYAMLNREITAAGGIHPNRPLLLGYTGVDNSLLELYAQENDSPFSSNSPRTIIGSVIGTHAGPGAVAAAFFKK